MVRNSVCVSVGSSGSCQPELWHACVDLPWQYDRDITLPYRHLSHCLKFVLYTTISGSDLPLNRPIKLRLWDLLFRFSCEEVASIQEYGQLFNCHVYIISQLQGLDSVQYNSVTINIFFKNRYVNIDIYKCFLLHVFCYNIYSSLPQIRLSIDYLFLNPLLFVSCTDTVKLLEAWRGVLSSTPPYK
jgi:hypothetical protein